MNGSSLLKKPLYSVFGMATLGTSSRVRQMSMRRKPESAVLISSIVFFVANDAHLLSSLDIDGFRVVIAVAVDGASLFQKPFGILIVLLSDKLPSALRTTLTLYMIVWLLPKLSVFSAYYANLFPTSNQVDLGIIIFISVNGTRLFKE